MDAHQHLIAARLWAVHRMPYLASALFACPLLVLPGTGTVAVDRSWRIRADPEVVARSTVPDLGRLLLHLVGHLLRDHAGRAGALHVPDERNGWWQRCTDAEINDDLATRQDVPPVAATMPASLGQQDGRPAEAYFGAPPVEPSAPPWDCGSGADGRPRPGEDGPAGGRADADQDGVGAGRAGLLRHATAAAVRAQEGQQPGSVAGGWLRWAEALQPSRTDWRRILAAELRAAIAAVAGNVDYSYRRLSRRTTTAEPRVVQPALRRPLPRVAVVCDTSGSMGDAELADAVAEIDGLLRRTGLRSSGLSVLAVDTEVRTRGRVRAAAQVRLAGGGGTDMAAGLTAAAALRPRPQVVIVLTDGWTPWPDHPPAGVRVIVGLIGRDPREDTPAWARTVLIGAD